MNTSSQLEFSLRPWDEGDQELEYRLTGDPAMRIFLGEPKSREQALKLHEDFLELNRTRPGCMFVIEVGRDRVAAGSVGFWEKVWIDDQPEWESVWETGWDVLPEFQGHGLASRATVEALTWARDRLPSRYAHAFPSVDNTPSNGVCRKAGFELCRVLDVTHPPHGPVRSNHWRFELFPERLRR